MVQAPSLHAAEPLLTAAHAMQPPQCFTSLLVSKHWPLQHASVPAQPCLSVQPGTQRLDVQTVPGAHSLSD
jgi:hypothetical protein